MPACALDHVGTDDEGDTGAENSSGVELDETFAPGPASWHAAYSTKIPNRNICTMCRVIASPVGAIGRRNS
jgi:hypothetical protein